MRRPRVMRLQRRVCRATVKGVTDNEADGSPAPADGEFTPEGRRTAATPCPANAGGKHTPDATNKALGTFFCIHCGAVPKDSVWAKT